MNALPLPPIGFSLLDLAVPIAAGLTVLGSLVGALYALWRFLLKHGGDVRQDEQDDPVLHRIAREFDSNGGSTLKEQVTEIRATVVHLETTTTELAKTLKMVENRQTKTLKILLKMQPVGIEQEKPL